jgi:hypothetical protein
MTKIDEELRTKSASFQSVTQAIAAEKKKATYVRCQPAVVRRAHAKRGLRADLVIRIIILIVAPCSGNLMVRDLSDLIKPEDAIDTDYLTTLFVVVNK